MAIRTIDRRGGFVGQMLINGCGENGLGYQSIERFIRSMVYNSNVVTVNLAL